MARLQDFPTVNPTSSDKILVVQSQGQGLVPYGSKLDSANPTGTGTLTMTGSGVFSGDLTINGNQSLTAFRNDAYSNPTTTGLTLKNGAENYGFTSYYYKKLGRVTVNMSIKSLSSASTVIATLPENYRPRTETTFFVGDGSATGNCSVVIATNGNMTVWKSSTQYAIGEISFDAFN